MVTISDDSLLRIVLNQVIWCICYLLVFECKRSHGIVLFYRSEIICNALWKRSKALNFLSRIVKKTLRRIILSIYKLTLGFLLVKNVDAMKVVLFASQLFESLLLFGSEDCLLDFPVVSFVKLILVKSFQNAVAEFWLLFELSLVDSLCLFDTGLFPLFLLTVWRSCNSFLNKSWFWMVGTDARNSLTFLLHFFVLLSFLILENTSYLLVLSLFLSFWLLSLLADLS